MKVLHFNSLLNGGGTDEHCLLVLKILRTFGINALLAGPAEAVYYERALQSGIPAFPVPREKRGLILSLARILREEQIEILHVHHGRDFWPAVLAKRLSGSKAKLVITRHLAKAPSSWVSRRFLLSQCSALIAVSEFVRSVLQEGSEEPLSKHRERRRRRPLRGDTSRIQVVHNGVDTDRFRPFEALDTRHSLGLKAQDYAFGVVGAYESPHGKGQREFLRAAAIIKNSVPHARFLIVGRGDMREVLLDDIARLGLAGKASLVPFTNGMPSVMNALDCLVHPATRTEAFGLVVLEAFACGRPVIASRLDGIPEAFEAGGYGQLVAPGAVAPLARAMLEQARLPALSQQERQKLHNAISRRYSMENMGRKVLRVYESVLYPSLVRASDLEPAQAQAFDA